MIERHGTTSAIFTNDKNKIFREKLYLIRGFFPLHKLPVYVTAVWWPAHPHKFIERLFLIYLINKKNYNL